MALEEFRAKFSKAMMELAGAFILVLTIQLAVLVPGGPLAIGLILAAAIYAGFPISGAHYNPAISFAVFLRGAISLQDMFTYWVFQLIGGCLGAIVGGLIGGSYTALSVGKDYNFVQAFLGELVITSILCFVVLATATTAKNKGNNYYGIAIGVVVFAGSTVVGPISGGGFNPAVALGLGLVKHFWKLMYAFWVVLANFIGAVLGAILFYIVDPEEFSHFGDEAHGLMAEARSLLPGQGA